MAETKLINFRYGTYDEINGLGKGANCIYFAIDKPLFYAVGKWHGIASMTSEVDRANSKTILKINGDGGYAINCEIEGETLSKDLKEKLINAYEFVQLISGEDEDAIINKWNEIVAFLQGFGEADKLLNVVVELQNNLADEVANRISADQKHTEDIKSITDLVNDMFTLVDKGDGTKYIQSKYGFASDSFISARGVDNEASGGGGLDAQAVWDLLMQNDDATKIINVAHIPDITISKITDIANASVANATNADTLDGLHAKDFVKYFVGTSVAEVQSSSLGYGQTEFGSKVNGLLLTGLYLDGKYGGQINGNVAGTELYYRGKTGSGWTTWKQLAFTDSNITGNAASASALYRPSRLDNVDYTADKIGSFTHLLINSVIGDNFPFPLGSSSILHMEWDSLNSYSRQLAVGGDRGINEPNNRLKWRAQNKGVWCDWKTVAFTDTNSLAPSGGTLTVDGNLITNKVASKFLVSFIGNDNTERIALQNNSSNDLLIGGGYTDKTVYLDANIFRSRANTTVLGGKVGIGTSSPTAKLHVNGTALIADNTTINGNLQVSNQLTIGNATLYWDVASQCLRVNAGIASDSFLSAKGIDTTGNGQGGGGGFDATMLWNELTIPSPTNSGKVISSQFLPVQEILTPVASDISEINAEIIALQDRIANIEKALTWQGVS